MHNLPYENEWMKTKTHFHMKGYATRLALKTRYKTDSEMAMPVGSIKRWNVSSGGNRFCFLCKRFELFYTSNMAVVENPLCLWIFHLNARCWFWGPLTPFIWSHRSRWIAGKRTFKSHFKDRTTIPAVLRKLHNSSNCTNLNFWMEPQ